MTARLDIRGGGFRLRFASRMNIDTLARAHPHRARTLNGLTYVYYSYMGRTLRPVHFKAQPSTEYKVRIDPGMEDIYGNAIADPLTFSFTTGRLPPTMGLARTRLGRLLQCLPPADQAIPHPARRRKR